VLKSAAYSAAGGAGCFAVFFALIALWAIWGEVAEGQAGVASALVVGAALAGLAVGALVGAIHGAWKAMGWPQWAWDILTLSVLGGLIGLGTLKGVLIGALLGAALGTIIELDLGMRMICTVGKALGGGAPVIQRGKALTPAAPGRQ
jgi:hypothetical protein